MDPGIIVSFLKKWLWLAIVFMLFAAIAAYITSSRSPKIYEATSILLVNQGNRGNTNSELAANERMAVTFKQRLASEPVIAETIQQVGLNLDEAKSLDIDVKNVNDTQLIEVIVKHTDPETAQAVANAMPDVFSNRNKAQLLARYDELKANVEAETAALNLEIEELEQVLAAEDNTIQVNQLQKKLQQLYKEEDRLYDDLSDIRLADTLNLDAIIVDVPDRLPAQIIRPEQYDEIKANLEEEAAALSTEILELEQEIELLDSSYRTAPLEKRLAQLYREQERLRADFAAIRLAETMNLDAIIVDVPAPLPTEPISPNVMQTTVLAALIAAVTGLGIAFLIELLDDTVKPGSAFTQQFGSDPLVEIGRIDNADEGFVIANTMPRSSIAESYRMLRTNITFTAVDSPVKTLIVTSANPDEGKSITAANLAVVMAQSDNRVLLIDADLRKPTQDSIFNIPNSKGLTTAILNKDEPVDQNIVDLNIPGLWLLPSGPLPPNPSELLGSDRMGIVLAKLEETFDIVIIDSPPVLVVTDSSVLARSVSGVLVVVRANQTHIEDVKRVQTLFKGANVRLLGFVLNDVRNLKKTDYTAED